MTPEFLTNFTPTRTKHSLLPIGFRLPATGRLGEVWHKAAERDPDTKVIADRPPDVAVQFGAELTYAVCASIVDQLAARLHTLGVRPSDRVAVIKRNHLDYALLASATARLGAIPALISDNHDHSVLATLLQRLENPYLVTDAQTVAAKPIDPELTALTTRTVVLDDLPKRTDIRQWQDLTDSQRPPVALRDPDQPQVITHTSGTTGAPKLVMHSAASLYALALPEAERWPFWLNTNDTIAFCNPYSHQRMMTALLALAAVTPTIIFLSDPADPAVRDMLVHHKPTFVETLPNGFLHWEPLTKDPAKPFARVKVYVSSFDGIHTRTVRAFLHASQRLCPLWVQAWSQTEAGSVAIRPYIRSVVRKVGKRPPPTQFLGWPVPGFGKLRAVDPDTGQPVPAGEVGLIQICAPGRCLGYVGETARYQNKTHGQWWDLGDLGVINRWGAVRLIDREVDRISGASALELEDLLLDRIPETTEVVMLAIRDGLPQPVVSTVDDIPLDMTAWRAAVTDLPRLSEPLQIRWDEFPRTATWKIQRVRLREQLLPDAVGIGKANWT